MIKINLLPGKGKKDSLKIDIYLFIVAMLIMLATFSTIYYINAKAISDYNKKIENAKKEIASLQSIYNEYLNMEREKKEIQRRIKAIDSIKEGRALSARIMYDLPGVIKDNVWLKNFRKADDKFELEGRSLENESIATLVESLQKLPYMKNIELRNVEDATEEGVTVKKFMISGNIVL